VNRPWQIGLAFGLALAVVLAAMGWISAEVLRLDRAQAEARRRALQEENVRLALWRMESALGPVVAQESAWPYFAYAAFYRPERAYTDFASSRGRFHEATPGNAPGVLLPSPILTQASPYVLLNFQFGPGGDLTSPQVPTGDQRGLAEAGNTTAEAIGRAASRLADLGTLITSDALAAALPREGRPAPGLSGAELAGAEPAPQPQQTQAPQTEAQQTQVDEPQPQDAQGQVAQSLAQQRVRSANEQKARFQNVESLNTMAQMQSISSNTWAPGTVEQGPMTPLWLDGVLVLARRVTVSGREYVQGVWLDWPAVRSWLLDGVKDLVPNADLVPARGGEGGEGERLLAALPARLMPGAVPAEEADGTSPILLSLAVAWACTLVAAAAVGVLLVGTVALSERRGDFVSAVTHELRTPLTTFRMYSEMLAEGMVPDEDKRRRYLATLRAESERLTHLVENVLAYARLERGRARGRTETVTLGQLAAAAEPHLAERARQAGMELVVRADADASETAVRADASAVEQVLFNLVDNACKYAASAADRRIDLVADGGGDRPALKVCDRGPGVSRTDARRLFRPFSKSASKAAASAPGVGLGLALSRRLAREMGGDLVLESGPTGGACFALRLVRAT
jgi:signal transduction histidine kinase